MPFTVKANGKPILEIWDQRVTRIGLQTSQGEAGSVGIDPSQNEINLIIEVSDPRDKNLLDVEAVERPRNMTAEDEAEVFPPVQPNSGIHGTLSSIATTENAGLVPDLLAAPPEFPSNVVTDDSDDDDSDDDEEQDDEEQDED